MIYALKLLTVVFTVTCIAAYVFRSAFRNIFSEAEYKRVWRIVLLGVVASYLSHLPELFMIAAAAISYTVVAGHAT